MTVTSEARDRDRARPVYLVEVALKNAGPVLYFSDRTVEVAGRRYEDFLEGLSGLGQELRRSDSGCLNADIALRFKNERYGSYGYLVEIGDAYPFEGAGCVIKEVYLDDDGAPSDAETVFKGVFEGPSEIDLMGFACRVSSAEFAADRRWKQEMINTADYPGALEDVGRVEPVVYGSDILMPALRTDWGAGSTLLSAVSEGSTSLELSDASRFPTSGSIWVDDEKIGYASKSDNILLSLSRGQDGTGVTAHRAGSECREHRAQYESLLASHELYSVGDIYAEIEGRLLRVTSGVSAVLSGGKHLLRATERIRVEAADIKSAYSPAERLLARKSSNIPVQQRYFNATGQYEPMAITFPAAPQGDLEEVRTRVSWNAQVKETFTGEINVHTGPGGSYPRVCTIKGDGTVVAYFPSTYESQETAWVASRSLYYTATNSVAADRVVFTITDAVEEAVVASGFSGDPEGGEVSRGAAGAPLQRDYFNSGGYYEALSVSFPQSPQGTLSEIRTRVQWNIRVNEAPLTEINFHSGPGGSYPLVATVKADGTLITYAPDMEESRSAWTTSAAMYYNCASAVGAGKVVLTAVGAGESARSSSEASVFSVDNITTRSVERFHAVVGGFKDPDGNYGGAGSVIERPDYVIKHFLVEMMGFGLADIDAASFDAAGSSYAAAIAGGYRFAFVLEERITPSEFLKRLAFECRSTLKYEGGAWRLGFIPDAAPAPSRAVASGELAGRHAAFVFSRAPVNGLANEIAARYRRNYSRPGQSGLWAATAAASDSASISKHGAYPGEIELLAVRADDMASHVLAHVLRERAAPLMSVRFTVFYSHFGMRPGDTIEVENPLWGGRRFYVENIRRLDRFRAEVRAVEWWS